MAAPELRLNVSFDLAYFKGTALPSLATAAAGFRLPIQVKFDRSIINSELNALQKSIKRRAWAVNLQVNDTTVKTAQDNVGKLRKSLDDLTSKTYELRIGTKGTGGKTAAQQISEIENILKNGLSGKAFGGGAVASARSNVERQALVDKISKGSLSKGGYNKAGIEEVIRRLGATPGGSDVKGLRTQAIKLAKSVDDAILSRVWNDVKDLQMNMNRSRFMKDVGRLPQVVKGVGTSPTGFNKTPATINKEATLGMTDALAQGSKSILSDLLSVGKGLVSLERGIARFLRGLPATGVDNTISNAIGAGGRSAIGSGIKGGLLGATGGGLTGAGVGAFRGVKAVAAQGLSQWSEGGSLSHGLGAGMRKAASVLGGDTAGLETFVRHGKEQVTNAILSSSFEGALVGLGGVGIVAGGLAFTGGFGASLANDGKSAILETAKILFTKSAQLVVSAAKSIGPIAAKGLALTGQGLAEGTKRLAPYAQEGGRALGTRAIAGGIVTGEYAGKGLQVARDRLEDALVKAYVAINGIPDKTTWRALKQRALALMGAMEIATVQVTAVGEVSSTGIQKMLRGKDRANNAPLVPTSIVGTFVEDLGTSFQLASKYLPRPNEVSNRLIKEGLDNIGKAGAEAAKQSLNQRARQIANQMRGVSVSDLGTTVKAFANTRIAGLLPAVGPGRYRNSPSQADIVARRVQQAQERSRLREIDVMAETRGRTANPYSYSNFSTRFSRDRVTAPQRAIVPYDKPGALVYAGGGGGGGTGGGPGNFAAAGGGGGNGPGNFIQQLSNIKLPGSGAIASIGNEFANAAKQVLLFGTAYKALAFAQSFPAQIMDAVTSLQSYRNSLKEITPSAKEFADSNNYILGLVDKYNIPLDAARSGFTKLYASMAPAGFSGNQIRDLFGGISKAAATFGMSSDKVDRVTYAFAQMASKGQVMSEELKGQLGDVLPGALGIFADAAGFKGKDAITKFGKALEDGAFKGDKMVQLLNNVTVKLNEEFGPGAEGAARTMQGVMNRMANSTKLFYETFEPLAINFANSVVVPITNGIKTLTDGFNAFFTNTEAKTSGGKGIAETLKSLAPSFEGIKNNLAALIPSLQTFAGFILQATKALIVLTGNPIVGFLLKMYANVLLVNAAFTLLGGKILVQLIASAGTAIARFFALNAAVLATQRTTAVANSSLAGTQQQMALLTRNAGAAIGPINILKGALVGLARFAIVSIALEIIVNGMAELDRLKKSLDEIAGFSSKAYKKEVQGLSKEEVNSRIIVNRRTQKDIDEELAQYTANGWGALRGLFTGRDEELQDRQTMVWAKGAVLSSARGNLTQKQLDERRYGLTGTVASIPGGDAKTKKAAAQNLEGFNSLQDKLADEATKAQLERDKQLFENKKRLIDLEFAYRKSGATETQKFALDIAKKLKDAEIAYLEEAMAASQDVKAAAGSVAPGFVTATKAKNAMGIKVGEYVGGGNTTGVRPVKASEIRDVMAATKAKNLEDLQTIKNEGQRNVLTQTYKNIIKESFDTLFPVAEMQRTNALQAERNRLTIEGVPTEVIDLQENLKVASEKAALAEIEFAKEFARSEEVIKKYNSAIASGNKLLPEQAAELQRAQEYVKSYGNEIDTARQKFIEFTIAQTEAAIAALKQADALKKQQETIQRIDSSVQNATSSYKDFVKEVIKGGDPTEALKKFQEALTDQALTVFLDFAMKPVESFLNDSLRNIFKVPTAKETNKESIDKLETQLDVLKANAKIAIESRDHLAKIEVNTQKEGITGTGTPASGKLGPYGADFSKLFPPGATGTTGGNFNPSGVDPFAGIDPSQFYKYSQGVEQVDKTVTSSAENYQVVSDSMKKQAEEQKKTAEQAALEGKKFQETLGKVTAGIGIAVSSMMTIMAGVQQIKKGGTGNTIAGIGSILMGLGSGIGGFASLLKGANGGIAAGGWKPFPAFANGGTVKGPTLGLVGEGKYNEAIIPLPDGKSVPVMLQGSSIRDRMGSGSSGNYGGSPVLSMSFESTTINGVEYVSRDQLERAMSETRRAASKEGAARGSTMAIDKIKNSPSTRRSIGIR